MWSLMYIFLLCIWYNSCNNSLFIFVFGLLMLCLLLTGGGLVYLVYFFNLIKFKSLLALPQGLQIAISF